MVFGKILTVSSVSLDRLTASNGKRTFIPLRHNPEHWEGKNLSEKEAEERWE